MTKINQRRRLPENIKFHIWPTYYLEVDGVGVYPTKTQAEILLFLMSEPGKRFTAKEVAAHIYADRADGGPEATATCIGVQVVRVHLLCQRAGIDLHLKMGAVFQGYAFTGACLTDKGRAELERRAAIPAAGHVVVPVRKRGRKPVVEQVTKKRRKKDGTAYRYEDTGNWAFPERHERNRQPA